MMRIYLANLGRYNEGAMVGRWFDLPVDLESALREIGVDGERVGGFTSYGYLDCQ